MTIISGIGPNVNSQFNELMTSQRTPVIELKSVYGLSVLRDIVITTGAGTVTNTSTEFQVSVTTNALDSATLDSAERGRYMPGYAGQAGIGVRIPENPEDEQVFQWGMFDDVNGAYFEQGVEGLEVIILRAGVVIENVPQAMWNVDPLDGTGPSGLTLDVADGNIYQINFTWYGYGVIEFAIVMQNAENGSQEVITVHRYKPEDETSFADPNLPLRASITNNNAAPARSIFVGGRQYSIVGKFNPEFRVTSERRTVAVTTTGQPVLAFQRKAVFPAGSARPNSVSVTLEGIDIITNEDIFFQIILGGELNTAFSTFPTATTNIPNNETALLVNNNATAFTVDGEVYFQGVAASGGGAVSRDLAVANLLDLELPDDEIITLFVGGITTTANITAVFRVTEEW
ncbi:hypothetical protein MM221_01650 [Salipaludibacillus sp. LMS25]|uniref:hypothetical protein n=1 Tax=Salipaludibacillus sp. LMS25 TaxID=2924031 RepID=UPI0020D01A85|nr:hypothetical protein [Salipaludibacillus sp. LMS25]UTR15325.1 hypothetical protein MM221_01650 [Salipaludibacillus sp. LMS25]